MSERAKAREVLQRLADLDAIWQELPAERRSALPPDDDTCRDCSEWRMYPPGQEHFGFAWWRTCPWTCSHDHHRDETWLALEGAWLWKGSLRAWVA